MTTKLCDVVLQQVGTVTIPCCAQVESAGSFRATLVSTVQGRQIGLDEIQKPM